MAEDLKKDEPLVWKEGISAADLVEEEFRRKGIEISELGKQILAARRAVEQSGLPLLNEEELEKELEMRGLL